VSYRYQWLRCAPGHACVAIAGAAGQTYTVTKADIGAAIEVSESATNASGTGPSATSAASAIVAPSPPTAVSPPVIAGTPRIGWVLIEIGAQWTQSPASFGFQWWRCRGAGSCTAIAGATGATYAPRAGDLGATIRVSEWASNPGGTGGPVRSAPVGPIAAGPAPPAPGAARIRADLARVLVAPAHARTGPRSPRAFTLPFTAPGRGRLVITWSVKSGRGHVQLATVALSLTRAGAIRVRVALSARGRRLLAHARKLWVQASASFTPAGHGAVRLSRGFWVHR
jgi:hypothetical protein